MTKLTWLITGSSSGLGEQLFNAVLARGDNMIATARNSVVRLKPLAEAGATVLKYGVTAPQATIDAKMNHLLQVYGSVNILVNNAGYIEAGLVEEVR